MAQSAFQKFDLEKLCREGVRAFSLICLAIIILYGQTAHGQTSTSAAIDNSFATHCLQAESTNSFYNSCNFTVIDQTITESPNGWIVIASQPIEPGRRGGVLDQYYSGRYYYMGCRNSDVQNYRNNKCVQVFICLHDLYTQRAPFPSAERLLGRCGVSLNVAKGR